MNKGVGKRLGKRERRHSFQQTKAEEKGGWGCFVLGRLSVKEGHFERERVEEEKPPESSLLCSLPFFVICFSCRFHLVVKVL